MHADAFFCVYLHTNHNISLYMEDNKTKDWYDPNATFYHFDDGCGRQAHLVMDDGGIVDAYTVRDTIAWLIRYNLEAGYENPWDQARWALGYMPVPDPLDDESAAALQRADPAEFDSRVFELADAVAGAQPVSENGHMFRGETAGPDVPHGRAEGKYTDEYGDEYTFETVGLQDWLTDLCAGEGLD